MKNVLIINGSASRNSSNQKLIEVLVDQSRDFFTVTVLNNLKELPHFDPELSESNTPEKVLEFRNQIAQSDGVIFCTPEYIFSIPSGLKNCIEWCVSTTVFSDKPTGIITASASGLKGHEELKLIMNTLMTKTPEDVTLLIQGIKGKFNETGEIKDQKTYIELSGFVTAMRNLIENSQSLFK